MPLPDRPCQHNSSSHAVHPSSTGSRPTHLRRLSKCASHPLHLFPKPLSFADQCLRAAAVCGSASCTACQCYFHVDAVKPSCSDFRTLGGEWRKKEKKSTLCSPRVWVCSPLAARCSSHVYAAILACADIEVVPFLCPQRCMDNKRTRYTL